MKLDNPIIIRDKAREEIRGIIESKSIPEGYGLRLGIKGAGCSGLGFLIGFDRKKDEDLAYDIDGVNVLINKKHMMYVVGLEVDFYEGSDARGFTFTNPSQLEKTKGR